MFDKNAEHGNYVKIKKYGNYIKILAKDLAKDDIEQAKENNQAKDRINA